VSASGRPERDAESPAGALLLAPTGQRVRAVAFDLDGTLYHQPLLRAWMAAELALLPVRGASLARARTVWRAIAAFRRCREGLREAPPGSGIAARQYRVAAEACRLDPAELEAIVEEWMYERPLAYLARCRRRGLRALLGRLAGASVPVGIYSDYPDRGKLRALGIEGRVSAFVASTDPEVDCFKPHPRGFQRLCERLGVAPGEVLYVGDRPEVDAAGARAAGMACVIVGRREAPGAMSARSLEALGRLLVMPRAGAEGAR